MRKSPILTKNLMKMKAKRFIFGLLACVTLLAVSCEPNNTAEEDDFYEVGVDKSKLTKKI